MTPKVSIGVPVFNGAHRILDSLTNLSCQTFGDFEVIVSDNASTDGSAELVEAFCRRDPRFRLIRQPENVGPMENFRSVVQAAKTDLFLWRADDDLSSLNYVELLHGAMRSSPNALLAVARRIQLRVGRAKKRVGTEQLPVGDPAQYSATDLLRWSTTSWFYGMMRTEYARTSINAVIADYGALWAWDHLMVLPAIAKRRVTAAYDAVFFHRLQQRPETASALQEKEPRAVLGDRYLDFCRSCVSDSDLSADQRVSFSKAVERHASRILAA
ncbi:MAG: glycosyltransferase family 2 protein [Pseudomonadota bacterium]